MPDNPHPIRSQYRWYHELRQLFVVSLERYGVGERDFAHHFSEEQETYLTSIGMTPQELYDFAEDHVKNDGDPDFETMLLIATVRRDYLLTVQHGQTSERSVSMNDLPPKDAKLGGIPWLPRLIKKAEAKLHGAMPADLMYGCGGDRRFCREYGIHPADFLRHVWAVGGDEQKILAYVQAAKPSATFAEV